MINDNEHHQNIQIAGDHEAPVDTGHLGPEASPADISEMPHIHENVRATLSPFSAPRAGRSSISDVSVRSSNEGNRKSWDTRRSVDATRMFHRPSHEDRKPGHDVRRGFSGSLHNTQIKGHAVDPSPLSPKAADSESVTLSLEPGVESSAAIQSMDESSASASQILNRSDVFRGPANQTIDAAPLSKLDMQHRHSQETTRSTQVRSVNAAKRSRQPQTPTGVPDFEDDTDTSQAQPRLSGSSSALQDIASYPLQKASGLAGFLRTRSKKMGNLLASESMGYYEKVSGMLAGGRKHYNTAEGLETGDQVHGFEDDEDAAKAAENFRDHFAFPESEVLQSSFFASLQRVLPNYGKIYISGRYFCFRSLMPTSKTKIILPMRDIENVNKEKGFRLGYHGLAIVIKGHEELFFEFSRAEYRDECAITVLRILENTKYLEDEDSSSSGVDSDDEAAKAEHDLLQQARENTDTDQQYGVSEIVRAAEHDRIPLIFDDPLASFVDFKPSEPLTVVCLTIGSRGDVQPYIALCKELLKEGHKPRIATHAEFEPWVRKHGIDFAVVDGNPAELMRICVEHGMFTYGFMKEANSKFRGWLDDVCSSSWRACQGADVLIESPSTMAGIHIAEALEIPYFRAFTMPWTRTRAYPHAFSVMGKKMGGGYNSLTYITFDTIFWTAISGQVNKWRRRELGLQGTTQQKMQANLRPFLYNFSPHVVPPPLDWPDWVRVTGYWFLDESDSYEPPAELTAFMEKARADGKKLVYVGFGSIVIDDPAALTRTVVDSVLKADVRCVLSKGWSDRLETKDASKPEIPLPPEVFQIQAAPHDWLFKQMDAAVHHGGSGTTGASLRAGIPTIIKPFFGDQFFFAQRVEDMGVGVWLKRVNTSVFSRALWEVTNSQRMIVKANVLGQKIRKVSKMKNHIWPMY